MPNSSANKPSEQRSLKILAAPPYEVRRKLRVAKACERCKLRKTKCEGKLPCRKCVEDDVICLFQKQHERNMKREVQPGYVDFLETQYTLLLSALREAQTRLVRAGAWDDAVSIQNTTITSSSAEVSIQHILEHLGVTHPDTCLNSLEAFSIQHDPLTRDPENDNTVPDLMHDCCDHSSIDVSPITSATSDTSNSPMSYDSMFRMPSSGFDIDDVSASQDSRQHSYLEPDAILTNNYSDLKLFDYNTMLQLPSEQFFTDIAMSEPFNTSDWTSW